MNYSGAKISNILFYIQLYCKGIQEFKICKICTSINPQYFYTVSVNFYSKLMGLYEFKISTSSGWNSELPPYFLRRR